MFEELRENWAQLGVGFVRGSARSRFVDLEKTIIDTSHAGREESRLLFGMRAWLIKHHGLVNNSRLIRMIKMDTSTAVLGAILDSILEGMPRSTLRYAIKHCKKSREAEFVFTRIANSKVQSMLNREENLAVWKKWNLISREMSSMEGVIMDESYVYRHNRNLALRALFGPVAKADVFAFLLRHKTGNAHQMAQSLGLSYEPVYSELTSFSGMGLVEEEKKGIARVFKIKAGVGKKLKELLAFVPRPSTAA